MEDTCELWIGGGGVLVDLEYIDACRSVLYKTCGGATIRLPCYAREGRVV